MIWQTQVLHHYSSLTILDIVSIHDLDLRSTEKWFLAKRINCNPLIPYCDDLTDSNFISLESSRHIRYSFYSWLWHQKFKKVILAKLINFNPLTREADGGGTYVPPLTGKKILRAVGALIWEIIKNVCVFFASAVFRLKTASLRLAEHP